MSSLFAAGRNLAAKAAAVVDDLDRASESRPIADRVVAAEHGEQAAPEQAARPPLVRPAGGQEADERKRLGNEAFAAGRYGDAVSLYSRALEADPMSAVLFSNRSGAHAAAGDYAAALADAERCVSIRPEWVKAHTRKAVSLHGLGRHILAIAAYDDALHHDLPVSDASKELLVGRRQASFALAIEP